MRKRLALSFQVLVLLIGSVDAATYWISSEGSAAWSSCRSETPLSGSAACPVSAIRGNVEKGDTVFFREGTYHLSQLNGIHIDITNRHGTGTEMITLSNFGDETVEFKGTYGVRQWGFIIQNSSYIRLKGFIFSDYSDYLTRASSNHIEITNCTFRNTVSPYRGGSVQFVEACIGGGGYTCPVSHIWFHGNTLYKLSGGGGCNGATISEGGDALRIGYYSITCNNGNACAEGLNSHFTVEDNYMAYAGHAVMDSYSISSVFRNNVAHNEPWYPADNGACKVSYQPEYSDSAYGGLYSHRVWAFTDTYSRDYSHNLIESNRLGHAGVNPNNDGATGLTIASPGNIIRFNYVYGTMHNPMKTKYGDGAGWQASGGTRNRIYQNTLYKGGYGYPFFQTCTLNDLSTCPKPLIGFRWYYPHDSKGNVLKNNIVYGSYGAEKGRKDIQDDSSGVLYANNLCTNPDPAKCSVAGDPLFINPDLSETSSRTLPDLGLRPGSPAIDAGTHLTKAVNQGTASSDLLVEDTMYFQDGTWGSDLARGVTHFPDWIAIGTVDNAVQISSIDYDEKSITLATPLTWSDGAPVWLYKDSTGRRVLYGPSVDIGAYEYAGQAACSPADTSGDGTVSVQELLAYIALWRPGTISMPNLMRAIREWKDGC